MIDAELRTIARPTPHPRCSDRRSTSGILSGASSTLSDVQQQRSARTSMRRDRRIAPAGKRPTHLHWPPARVLVAASAAALVIGCYLVGSWLDQSGTRLHLGQTWPLAGAWELQLGPWLLAPILLAALVAWGAPVYAARLAWGPLLGTSFLAALGWTIALAVVGGGLHALITPLTNNHDYLHDVPRVTDLGHYLSSYRRYVVGEPQWTTHVGGHPPGTLGLFVVLNRLGLGGARWAALFCIVAGCAAVPAVLATTRLLGSEALARRAAPFVATAPAALWVATSADALFAGVAAGGVCALAISAARHGWGSDGLAVLGGVALACSLFLSYGLAPMALLAVGVVAVQRRIRPLIWAGGVVALAITAMAIAGFNWFSGLQLASQRVRLGPAWQDRPALYFIFANLAALAIAVGPAALAGLTSIRRDRFAILPMAALLAIGLALISGLSKGEVERIYLPYAFWILPAAGLLPAISARRWLAASLTVALVIAATVRLWW